MNLSNHFLIAMPDMDDPFFSGSVVYLCQHDEDGALGIVINKPSPIMMEMVFSAASGRAPDYLKDSPVMMGGPVQIDRGFVLHTPEGRWQSSIKVGNGVSLTTSRDIIEKMGQNGSEAAEKAVISIGSASWHSGQLEKELAENAWLTVPADTAILFDTPPEQRYRAALAKLGVDTVFLMKGAGRA
ncbi:MAG: YqgE/AlgH family protein [Neisseria sp.]|nr:YqgE/AlgH family protein [Neisseria sp.]